MPLYTFLTVRGFERQHNKQGGKEKGVLVGWDENMNGLVGKWEQKKGETGTHSTYSVAGTMIALSQVTRAEEVEEKSPSNDPHQVIGNASGRQSSGQCEFSLLL